MPLRMLDAKADAERLGLDGDAAFVQHFKRVAGAVAQRQHDMIGFRILASPDSRFYLKPRNDRSSFNRIIGDPLLEADLAAQRDDLLAHLIPPPSPA
jgi:hypothetical protein